MAAHSSPSIIAALTTQIQAHPTKTALVFLAADGTARDITYAQLGADIEAAAHALCDLDLRPDDLVLLAFAHSYAVVATFLGAIRLGAIPAILPYFDAASTPEAYQGQVQRTVMELRPAAVITLPSLKAALASTLSKTPARVLTLPENRLSSDAPPLPAPIGGEATAYLQISSGTTGQPKAVMVTHGALSNYIPAVAHALNYTERDISVGWAPLYHDLGLVGQILRPLLAGAMSVLMAPGDWIRWPHILLQAVHRYRGTVTAMPNFAFNRCARNIRDADIQGIDLSSWRVIINGAERINLDSMQMFYDRFAPYGLRYEALMPAYGLAEHIASVSLAPLNQPLKVEWARLPTLQREGQVVAASPDTPDARPIVSCGVPIPGAEVAIVDERNRPLAERHIGEIVIRGGSLCGGYYNRPDLAFLDADDWFHTGDVGYMADGELYVCDRKKDLIITGGANIHPANIEAVAQGVMGEAASVCVAVGIPDARLGTERAVLICEVRDQPEPSEAQRWATAIRCQVSQECGVALADVYFAPRRWVVRTTSGKASRVANRQKYVAEHGSLRVGSQSDADIEPRVTDIFQRILGRTPVNPDNNFFALGGDSLAALHLVLEIEEQFGQELSSEFFAQPTIANLVRHLQTAQTGVARAETLRGPRGLPEVVLRLQAARKSNWVGRAIQMGVIYPALTRGLAWVCRRLVAQLLFWKKQRWLVRAFYDTLEGPTAAKGDVVGLSLLGNVGNLPRIHALVNARPDQFNHYVTLTGEEYLKQALERGRGIILLSYHSYPRTVSLLVAALWRHGYENLYALTLGDFDRLHEQPRPVLRDVSYRTTTPEWTEHLFQAKQMLLSNYIVMTAIDGQGGDSQAVVLPLHRRQWPLKQGFAELAVGTGATVLPVTVSLDQSGHYDIQLSPPLDNGPPTAPRHLRIEGLMHQCRDFLHTAWAEKPWTLLWDLMGAHLLWPPG